MAELECAGGGGNGGHEGSFTSSVSTYGGERSYGSYGGGGEFGTSYGGTPNCSDLSHDHVGQMTCDRGMYGGDRDHLSNTSGDGTVASSRSNTNSVRKPTNRPTRAGKTAQTYTPQQVAGWIGRAFEIMLQNRRG